MSVRDYGKAKRICDEHGYASRDTYSRSLPRGVQKAANLRPKLYIAIFDKMRRKLQDWLEGITERRKRLSDQPVADPFPDQLVSAHRAERHGAITTLA